MPDIGDPASFWDWMGEAFLPMEYSIEIVSGETFLSSGGFALPPSLALSISCFSPNSPFCILRSTWATKLSSSRDWHPLSRDQRRLIPIVLSLLRLQNTIVLVYPASNPISSQRPSLRGDDNKPNYKRL
ncbi:hypothetical protein MRB53_026399 [Persea americana]|uniref:Uncharacterized protein n=1 Tax=Persea americana TaxID=3435 RepID=A0ACC2LIQ9_PERAE|nr:hypothetical protein MRB53_026399 [Persea americana]